MTKEKSAGTKESANMREQGNALNGDGGKLPPALLRGNREQLTDLYVSTDVTNEANSYAFKVYIRLNGKGKRFTNVKFQHSIFDTCYLNSCVFDSCDFTGCRFVACNLHLSSFIGCTFDYATFERCQIEEDILDSDAPLRENLRMRFARTLRMNFQQVGDAKAVNKAISLELGATETYLKKSWSSPDSYYRRKYASWKRLHQFVRWLEFRILDTIWGNGENTLKLLRSIVAVHIVLAAYDTVVFGNLLSLADYWASLKASPGVFFGIAYSHTYPVWLTSSVAAIRLVAFAFLTAILVKRFGRR